MQESGFSSNQPFNRKLKTSLFTYNSKAPGVLTQQRSTSTAKDLKFNGHSSEPYTSLILNYYMTRRPEMEAGGSDNNFALAFSFRIIRDTRTL